MRILTTVAALALLVVASAPPAVASHTLLSVGCERLLAQNLSKAFDDFREGEHPSFDFDCGVACDEAGETRDTRSKSVLAPGGECELLARNESTTTRGTLETPGERDFSLVAIPNVDFDMLTRSLLLGLEPSRDFWAVAIDA